MTATTVFGGVVSHADRPRRILLPSLIRASVALPLGVIFGLLGLRYLVAVQFASDSYGDGTTLADAYGFAFWVLGWLFIPAGILGAVVTAAVGLLVSVAAVGRRFRGVGAVLAVSCATAVGSVLLLVMTFTWEFFWIAGLAIASAAVLAVVGHAVALVAEG